jgi:two-component system, NtrC family, nitrogen regulation sensor histidine kinase NtrY
VSPAARPGPARRVTYERRLLWMALATGLPGGLVSLLLIWTWGFPAKGAWTLTGFVVGGWVALAFHLRRQAAMPLLTLSNLLAALREGDFSVRAAGAHRGDALGEVMLEMNALTDLLRDQRLGAMEATALLRAIMSEIDVAVFAFDAGHVLRLLNRAGERLLGQPAERLLGRDARALGLADMLEDELPSVREMVFPGGAGRFEARRGSFRQAGQPMQLLVLPDVSRALRHEERQAWQRLIRVLGHELNNSLTPIRSIAGSLETMLGRPERGADWEQDARRGLAIIAARSESLSRFLDSYSRLARLPAPVLRHVPLGSLVTRVAALETRLAVDVCAGPEVVVRADPDQIEQLLINLVHNAADAALETGGGVRMSWARNGTLVEILVEDDGPGVSNTSNLFVPFFTTKPGGSGIGLVISRQIAEAHGGVLMVSNRATGRGCVARVRLGLSLPSGATGTASPSLSLPCLPSQRHDRP